MPKNLSNIERQRILEQLEKLAFWLDSSITLPGTRFRIGWDSIIGFVPGIGDFATATLSCLIVIQAKRLGVSNWTVARMLANVGMDALLGSVPLIGDLADMAFKANQKNLRLLRRQMKRQGRRKSSQFPQHAYHFIS